MPRSSRLANRARVDAWLKTYADLMIASDRAFVEVFDAAADRDRDAFADRNNYHRGVEAELEAHKDELARQMRPQRKATAPAPRKSRKKAQVAEVRPALADPYAAHEKP